MEPREIDALIAEKVLGLTLVRARARGDAADHLMVNCGPRRGDFRTYYLEDGTKLYCAKPFGVEHIKPYSTDIAAAWDVVRALSDRYHWRIVSPFAPGAPWFAGLTPLGVTGWNGRPDIEEPGDTAPLAIALAALSAVGAVGTKVE